jgi:acyl-CoA dehydrogenase
MSALFEAIEPVDPDLLHTMEQVLAHHGPSTRDPEQGIALDAGLWRQLSELGLTRLTGDEATGGSGAGWREAAALLGAAARHGVSLPLAEHDLLAGWLLERAGLPVDDRVRTVALLGADDTALAVPWASAVERVVVVRTGTAQVADLDAAAVSLTPGRNLLGEPRDDVRLEGAGVASTDVDTAVVERLTLRAALARAVQVTAALERVLDLTVEQVLTRVQFGRPLARFQAVQHQVADIAAEVALARSSVDAAVHAMDRAETGATGETGERRLAFLVAVARSTAGRAATVGVRLGHQLHGAIGTTLEHELHRSTLAAVSWRSEHGSTHAWEARVAQAARDAGPDGLWELVTGA